MRHQPQSLQLLDERGRNSVGDQHAIADLARVTSVLLDEDLTVHGKGDASRDFLHVEDTVAALDSIIHAPLDKVLGETFNVASGTHRDVLSIAHDIADRMDYSRKRVTFVGERPGQVVRHTGDWSKINRVLGWRPKVSWEDGLQRTIDWFKTTPASWEHQTWMRYIPIVTAAGKVEMH